MSVGNSVLQSAGEYWISEGNMYHTKLFKECSHFDFSQESFSFAVLQWNTMHILHQESLLPDCVGNFPTKFAV